jgi:hypothetical protein
MRLLIAASSLTLAPLAAGQLSIVERPLALVPASSVDQNGASFTITGMSGVMHRAGTRAGAEFLVALDNSNKLVRLNIAFAPDGSITTVAVLPGLSLAGASDYEAIAPADAGSVYLATETGPAIVRIDTATGATLASLAIPPVFSNIRSNYGFESLSRRGVAGELWTANEEALTVDGSLSSQAAGTVVRLLRYAPTTPPLAPAPAQQFAYFTDPWHGPGISGSRSGVSDLVVMPRGQLLVLERSLALGAGFFKNTIYRADTSDATDVSANTTGLAAGTFTPAAKTLLWSNFLNQNLEGLALGPRLPGNKRVLLGVVDDADPLSANAIISFELADASLCPGDHDASGVANIDDIFIMLSDWFAGGFIADVDGSGTISIDDIFIFLNAWFAGC